MVKNYSDYFEAVWTKINLTWVRQLSHNSDIDVKLASLESKAAQHKTFQQQAAGAIFGPNNANRQLTVVEKALRSLEDRAGQEFLNIKAIIQNEAALAKKQLLNVQMAFNNTLESYNVPAIRAEGAATTELLRATERRLDILVRKVSDLKTDQLLMQDATNCSTQLENPNGDSQSNWRHCFLN